MASPIIQPGLTDVHVDRPLTQIAIAYAQRPEAFIADRVFPVVPVSKKSDKYFVLPPQKRDEMRKQAPGAQPARRTHTVSNDSYSCDVWSLAEDLADQVAANYDEPLDAQREITEGLSEAGMIRKELEFVASYFTTGKWTTDVAGVNNSTPGTNEVSRWDRDDATPIEDVRRYKRIVQKRKGFTPNKLVLGPEAYDALLDHPDIVGRLDRGQTTGPAIVMRQNLAALFEVDEVLVFNSIYDTAPEGATASMSFIGSKSALLVYAAPRPSLYAPSGGYTFSWTGLLGAGALGMRMRNVRNDEREANMLQIQMAFDQKLVEPDLGQFFSTIVN